MNKNIIFILFIFLFYSCELQLPEEPSPPAWYLPITVPLIDTEYSFEGILQEGVINTTAESFEDCGSDANCDFIDEDGTQGNGLYDFGEVFIDENGNSIWDDYGLSDSLHNMMQIEFIDIIDPIGLGIAGKQLSPPISFFTVSGMDPVDETIQEADVYDFNQDIPADIVEDPIEFEMPSIEIGDIDDPLINSILDTCEDFIPSSEQNLPIPEEAQNQLDSFDAIDYLQQQINELLQSADTEIDLDSGISTTVDLPDLGSLIIKKIVLDTEQTIWDFSLTNAFPFTIESLVFNIYIGPIENGNYFTRLTLSDIAPNETKTEQIIFDSTDIILSESFFTEIEINIDTEQTPPDNCPLSICIANAIDFEPPDIDVDMSSIGVYGSENECVSNCNPSCLDATVAVCIADAVSIDSNADNPIVIDEQATTIDYGENAQTTCESNCGNPCLDATVAVCIADAVSIDSNADNPIVVDENAVSSFYGGNAQATCSSSCGNPCLDATVAVCVLGEDGSLNGDPETYQGESAIEDCELACNPCLEQTIYVCPADLQSFDSESSCNDNCPLLDCVSNSLFACTTDAIDADGNVDQDAITLYNTLGECESSCDTCFINSLFACTTDAIDADGNVNQDGIATYDTAEECGASCEDCFVKPIHACTTDAIGEDGSVSTDDLDGDGIPDSITIYDTAEECNASCEECFSAPLVGWQAYPGELTIMDIDGGLVVDALVVELNVEDGDMINDSSIIEISPPPTEAGEIDIKGALIDDGTYFDDFGEDGVEGTGDFGEGDGIIQEQEPIYPNTIDLTVDNGSWFDAQLDLDFPNIMNQDGTPYQETFLISKENSSSTTFNLSNKLIGNNVDPIEQFELSYSFYLIEPDDSEITIDLIDTNQIEVGKTGYAANVSGVRLDYISSVAKDIELPQVQSLPLEGLPAGFDNFKLYDIFMDLNLYNQIAIDEVVAEFTLIGKKCPDGVDGDACFGDEDIEGRNFPFSVRLDSQNRRVDNPCNHEIGDIAITKISINKDSQITRYFCSDEDPEPYEVIEEPFDGEDNVNLLDFIYFGPNQMNMTGAITIEGDGILREDDNLWGDFSIAAPLAFVFNEDWVFIPQDITTINALDESLSNQIEDALVEAEFNAEITNSSAFGISMSMLASDNTVFPLYIDDLDNLEEHCSSDIYSNQTSCIDNGFSWINYQDSLAEIGVSDISFQPISNDDDRAYYVEFFEEDINGEESLKFWIGRVIDVSFLPPEETDDNGFVTDPSVTFSTEVLDATRVSWFTASEDRYMVPMITLASTEGNPASLQTTNFLGVRSFLTFILDTDGLSRKNDKLIIQQQNTPSSNQ